MKIPPTIKRGQRGFTLIELLVSITVLALIGLLITQFMDATARTTRVSNRAVDAAAQARLAFDRIGMDLADLVRRTDTDFQAGNTPGGVSLLFLSGISSPDILSKTTLPGGNRGESVVSYQVASHADNSDVAGAARICLLRGTVPLGWNEVGFMGDSGGLPQRFTASFLPADFDVLAPGVLRMVVGFQLYPDNQSVTLEDGTTATAVGQIVYSAPMQEAPADDYIDLDRVSAIVVGLVVIDTETLKLLSAGSASNLAALFTVPPDSTTPSEAWVPLSDNMAALGSAPLPVRQAVRIYQRFYPITPYGRK